MKEQSVKENGSKFKEIIGEIDESVKAKRHQSKKQTKSSLCIIPLTEVEKNEKYEQLELEF